MQIQIWHSFGGNLLVFSLVKYVFLLQFEVTKKGACIILIKFLFESVHA